MAVMVHFRTPSGRYAVPVSHTLEVRTGDSVRPLPSPAPGVVGVIDREGRTVAVVDPFGSGGGRVLVVQSDGQPVGVVVDDVIGVVDVDAGAVAPAPAGQADAVVEGTIGEGDELTFLVDVGELVRSVRRTTEGAT